MKFCIDCQHCQIPDLGIEFAKCVRPCGVDLVAGGVKMPYPFYCSSQREANPLYSDACGAEGRHWVPLPVDDDLLRERADEPEEYGESDQAWAEREQFEPREKLS